MTALLTLALLTSAALSRTTDFGVFALGLVAGLIIVLAIRRDIHAEWNGTERRRLWDGRERRRGRRVK